MQALLTVLILLGIATLAMPFVFGIAIVGAAILNAVLDWLNRRHVHKHGKVHDAFQSIHVIDLSHDDIETATRDWDTWLQRLQEKQDGQP